MGYSTIVGDSLCIFCFKLGTEETFGWIPINMSGRKGIYCVLEIIALICKVFSEWKLVPWNNVEVCVAYCVLPGMFLVFSDGRVVPLVCGIKQVVEAGKAKY